jgi:hypothetical protein
LDFAEWALGELSLPPKALIIDPWNGSATTAAACARMGVSCQGYDINPVMVHLGRARVASSLDVAEAEELIGTVGEILGNTQFIDIQTVGAAFRDLPVGNESAHSAAISALFPYARALLKLSKTKNPSWFKKGATFDGMSLNKSEFFASWLKLLGEICQWRSTQGDSAGIAISIERGDSRKSLARNDAFDGILTSPPYLTRLDYVQATLPEFLLLKELDVVPDIQRLRRSMLGSPLTSERPERSVERLPPNIRKTLSEIENHSSKASASYYYRFFSTYFVDLQASMRNIAKVLKGGASGCIVVQSSNYKEITIDLADTAFEQEDQYFAYLDVGISAAIPEAARGEKELLRGYMFQSLVQIFIDRQFNVGLKRQAADAAPEVAAALQNVGIDLAILIDGLRDPESHPLLAEFVDATKGTNVGRAKAVRFLYLDAAV